MVGFEYVLGACNVAAQGFLQLLFAGRCTGKQMKIRYYVIYLFLLYAVVWIASGYRPLEMGLELLLLYGVSRFGFGADVLSASAMSILAVYAADFSFGIMNSLELLLAASIPISAFMLYGFALLGDLSALILCGVCYWFLAGQLPAEEKNAPFAGLLLVPALFFLAAQFYIMRTAYGRIPSFPPKTDTGREIALLVIQTLGLMAMFSTLYAYRRTCDGFRAMAALSSFEQTSRAQKRYVEEARARYAATKAFRHDIRNHLFVLDGLLKKKEVHRAREYLRKLDFFSKELSFPVHTGNPVADILLGDKLALAAASGAKIKCSLVLPDSCGVDDTDWCVIFANALDNAAHACAGLEDGGWIHIKGERQGDFYLLEFENACAAGERTPPRMGTGLSNIRSAAEKYGGTMLMERTDASFCLQVLLDISMHSDARSGQKA